MKERNPKDAFDQEKKFKLHEWTAIEWQEKHQRYESASNLDSVIDGLFDLGLIV